ncbi:hypothetical protein AB4Y77_05745 [Paenarthrobacter sp. YAF11_1]|nr:MULTISPECIES: hypothetical protein [unclassified Arthrobacter]
MTTKLHSPPLKIDAALIAATHPTPKAAARADPTPSGTHRQRR